MMASGFKNQVVYIQCLRMTPIVGKVVPSGRAPLVVEEAEPAGLVSWAGS